MRLANCYYRQTGVVCRRFGFVVVAVLTRYRKIQLPL